MELPQQRAQPRLVAECARELPRASRALERPREPRELLVAPPRSDGLALRKPRRAACIQSSKSRQFALSISYTSPRACLRP